MRRAAVQLAPDADPQGPRRADPGRHDPRLEDHGVDRVGSRAGRQHRRRFLSSRSRRGARDPRAPRGHVRRRPRVSPEVYRIGVIGYSGRVIAFWGERADHHARRPVGAAGALRDRVAGTRTWDCGRSCPAPNPNMRRWRIRSPRNCGTPARSIGSGEVDPAIVEWLTVLSRRDIALLMYVTTPGRGRGRRGPARAVRAVVGRHRTGPGDRAHRAGRHRDGRRSGQLGGQSSDRAALRTAGAGTDTARHHRRRRHRRQRSTATSRCATFSVSSGWSRNRCVR